MAIDIFYAVTIIKINLFFLGDAKKKNNQS